MKIMDKITSSHTRIDASCSHGTLILISVFVCHIHSLQRVKHLIFRSIKSFSIQCCLFSFSLGTRGTRLIRAFLPFFPAVSFGRIWRASSFCCAWAKTIYFVEQTSFVIFWEAVTKAEEWRWLVSIHTYGPAWKAPWITFYRLFFIFYHISHIKVWQYKLWTKDSNSSWGIDFLYFHHGLLPNEGK